MCCLTEETFLPIVNALKQLQALKYLNISCNYITIGGNSIISYKSLLSSFSRSYKTVENRNTDDYDTISVAGSDSERSMDPDQYNSTSPAADKAKFPCEGSSMNDYDTVSESVALGEIIPLCSPSVYEDPIVPMSDKTSNFYDDKSENSDDYNTHSITAEIVPSYHYPNVHESTILQTTEEAPLSKSTNADDSGNMYLAYDEITPLCSSESSVLQERSASNSINGTDACDYDTISPASETISQHSQISDNNTYISDISVARKLTKSYRSSESLLPDYGYEIIPMMDEITETSSNYKERPGNASEDDYENILPSIVTCDQNSLKDGCETMSEMLENDSESVDVYEDTLTTIDRQIPKHPSNKISENYESSLQKNVSLAINEITEVINCNCFLACLDISDCKLSDLQIGAVAIALHKTSTLKELNLSYNKIATEETARKIASVIINNVSLKSINLNNCNLQESRIILIAEALATITSLKSIDISGNNITDNSTQSLAAVVGENMLLEQLNLSHCFQYNADFSFATTEKGVRNILMPLTMHARLKFLSLHSSYINGEVSELLSIIIANNKSISHLDLTDCKLPFMKLITIAKILQSTHTLKFLSLSSNVIINEAAYEIALAISENFVLEHLALSDCELDERGFMDITESLLNISSIKHLDLSNIVITDQVAETLAFGIINNRKLTYLDVSFCKLQDIGYARIHEVVYKLPMVKEFDIRLL